MLTPGATDQRCRTSIQQAEADYFANVRVDWLDSPSRRAQLRKPFGFNNGKWEELKAMMQPGDELWEVCSSKDLWDQLMGWHYIELCRDGHSIAQMVLRMN